MTKSKHPPSSNRELDIEVDSDLKHEIEEDRPSQRARFRESVLATDTSTIVVIDESHRDAQVHSSERIILERLKDGPLHELEACNDRAVTQILEHHGLIVTSPAETAGIMLEITDKGRSRL